MLILVLATVTKVPVLPLWKYTKKRLSDAGIAVVAAGHGGQPGVLLNAAKEDTDAGIGSTHKVCQHDDCVYIASVKLIEEILLSKIEKRSIVVANDG